MQRLLRIDPNVPDRVETLKATSGAWSNSDIGKPLKLDGDNVDLCASGDEIYGFLAAVEPYTKDGDDVCAVSADVNKEAEVADEAGTLSVGDFVVAGTPTAVATATPTNGANVLAVASPSGDSRLMASAALAIKAGDKALVKAGAAFYAIADGTLVTKAINTDMAALSGTVSGAGAGVNVFVFSISSAGVLSTTMGTEGATLADVVFPAAPVGDAVIGFVIIAPTGTGDFVGGTTDLDDGTVIPAAVYVNTVGTFSGAVAQGWMVMAVYSSGAGRKALVRKV